MKAEKQSSPARTRVYQLIQNMSIIMLTTMDAHGMLISRPMMPLMLDRDGALWFFIDLRSAKAKQLDAINFNFLNPANATYVSLSGNGEIITERSFINRLWTPLVTPWFPDGPESSQLALLKFMPDVAEYWDSSQRKMVRLETREATATESITE